MGIIYNKYIKKPNLEMNYTKYQINELEKCMNDFWYFCKYVKIVHPDFGKIEYVPRWYQEDFLQKILDNRFFIGLLSRQVGKTISVAVYIVWYAMFHDDKTIGIVSNKEKSSKDILNRIKLIYENLDSFLKCGVKQYNMTNVVFDNGTEIMVSATSPDAFRGRTLNVLLCDELAFVSPNMAEDFWSANFPTLSASTTSKIIVISTPNGMYNLFHRIFVGAEIKSNGFVYCKFDYTVIPGRDDKWVKEQISILGKLKFNQEHAIKFLGSSNIVIDSDILGVLLTKFIDPLLYDLKDNFRVFEKPLERAQYFMGVDTGKGSGEHDSAIQVFKLMKYKPFKCEQVAVFQDNNTDVYEYSNIVHRIAIYYNNAYIICENNAEGSTVVTKLWWDLEYENLINESQKSTGLGVRATKSTKPKAVLLMKKMIENEDCVIYDYNTLNQLTTFIDKGNSRYCGDNQPDDLISALYWALYIKEFDIFDESLTIKTQNDNDDEDVWGILTDVDTSIEETSWMHY